MTIRMDEGAAELLDTLHRAGYAAYVVGGCVRDSLLGLTPHDWDLCTSALPQQVMELFGAQRCIPTGLQHGTVTVKQSGALYEITTFRTEGTYTDGRHPDEVHFVPDVRKDLARRDLTINAMAYNEKEGLVDPFGGQADLQSGIVRAVGVPRQRFTEDALRILRLYRFAARFGFAIDEATEAAAKQLASHLDCVSAERIEEELNKLLAAPQPGAYLEPEVLAFVLPELLPEELTKARRWIDALPAGTEQVSARWAALLALLLPLGETGARKALKRLKCSNARIDGAAVLVRECGEKTPDTLDKCDLCLQAKRLLGKYDLHTVRQLTALWTALAPEEKASFDALRAEADAVDAVFEQLFHFRGALSMANSGSDTNGSQFFIVQTSQLREGQKESMKNNGVDKQAIAKYEAEGGTPWLDGQHTVFGQVIEGMEGVDAIAAVATDENDRPLEEVSILSVTVETYTAQ